MRSSSSPLFSIVTATYNAGSLLHRTIASIAAQEYKNFQWIVIDGGSKDDTIERLEHAGPLVDRWLSEPDEGIADAWNKGIALAQGSHILLLNAGDTYDSDFLQMIAERCASERIVCSHARLLTENGEEAGVFRAQPGKLYRAMHVAHNWCAVPAHHYKTLGSYKKIPLAMDFEWFHRYYRKFGVAGFDVVDRVLGSYYLGGASDRNFRKSFSVNEKILLDNGTHPVTARLLRLAYTLNHALRVPTAR